MIFENTALYYLFSTVAQTFAALLGISGMFFVYYAQKSEEKRRERLEILKKELTMWSVYSADQNNTMRDLLTMDENEIAEYAIKHIKEREGKDLDPHGKIHIQRTKENLNNYNKYIIIESAEFKWLFLLSLLLIFLSIFSIPFSPLLSKNIIAGNLIFGFIILLMLSLAYKFYVIFRRIAS